VPVRSIAVVAIALVGLTLPHVAAADPKAGHADMTAPETVDDVFSDALWEDRAKVTVEELFAQLDVVANDIAGSEAVRADYEALVAAHDLDDSEALFRDYVRVKLAFEATRDAGWWHLHWRITNEKPNSDQIWHQWRKTPTPNPSEPVASADAECDELSALFAFSARRLGVHDIGLFWPTWNHVVAVWTVQSKDGSPVRIVVPTSQIFLGTDDSLGTQGFDPWTQKTIYEYRRRDVKSRHRIDADLARFFVRQAARHGHKSQATLQAERNARDTEIMAASEATSE